MLGKGQSECWQVQRMLPVCFPVAAKKNAVAEKHTFILLWFWRSEV